MILGISGANQSGKKTLYKCLCSILNWGIDSYNLKDWCKYELNNFISEKTAISTYTKDLKQQEIINDLLQSYYDLMNRVSNNTYWTKELEDKLIPFKDKDLCIVTDISNEIDAKWLKNIGGELIYINKKLQNGRNLNENTELEELANYILSWQVSKDYNYLIDTVSIQLRPILDKIISQNQEPEFPNNLVLPEGNNEKQLNEDEGTVEGTLKAFKHIVENFNPYGNQRP